MPTYEGLKALALDAAKAPKDSTVEWDAFHEGYTDWLWKKGRMVPSYCLIKAIVTRDTQRVEREFEEGV